jgi:hypothetical protein
MRVLPGDVAHHRGGLAQCTAEAAPCSFAYCRPCRGSGEGKGACAARRQTHRPTALAAGRDELRLPGAFTRQQAGGQRERTGRTPLPETQRRHRSLLWCVVDVTDARKPQPSTELGDASAAVSLHPVSPPLTCSSPGEASILCRPRRSSGRVSVSAGRGAALISGPVLVHDSFDTGWPCISGCILRGTTSLAMSTLTTSSNWLRVSLRTIATPRSRPRS